MPILQVEHLSKRFDQHEVLRDISFSIEKGEVLAIIGSSGGGKTTMLRCLNFLETADDGTISVDGKVIFDGNVQNPQNFRSTDKSKMRSGKKAVRMSDEELRAARRHFGLVFQSFNLFPQYNVLQNVTLAPTLAKAGTPDEINARARALIDRVGLTEKLDFYPCQLSGGQQQRVAIARSLALSPDILCFDEPTSALDPELTGEVLRVIRDLRQENMTMVIVTHEMEFARAVADKVIFMADGIIEEMGSPDEIFTNPKSPKLRSFLGNF